MMGFTDEGGAMDIRGAIFDCDGTLVDSMGMWRVGELVDLRAPRGRATLPLRAARVARV